jgi:phenylalanyl-tRNA synthetase beta subunit
MKVSYNWLQSYFKEQLPKQEKIAEVLTMHAFEVESMEELNGDIVFDIDILPNRSSDALSHRGIAKEISTLLGIEMKSDNTQIIETKHPDDVISVSVEEPTLCRRYISKVIDGVKVGPSPDWLKKRLESIGQKSINNIVDATNFVMFDIGQPLHAFDMDKLSGKKIVVRTADSGEKMITLDDKDVELNEKELVIADEQNILALAGIKGGKKAQVDESTISIVLEAANFEYVNIRKTSKRLNISTDSSKRFENNISPEIAEIAIEKVALLIYEIAGGGNSDIRIGESVGFYPRQAGEYKIGVSVEEINKLLGTGLSEKEVEDILRRLKFKFEKVEDPIKKVLEIAPQFVGIPYKYGASVTYDAPRYFDCSSFTSYLFAQSGIAIPRISIDQYVFGEKIGKKDLVAGDLVFSNTHEGRVYDESVEFMKGIKVEGGLDHCGIYLGDGKVIHSSRHNGDGVEIEELSESDKFKDIVGYSRIVGENKFIVFVPSDRLDLKIQEDLIEEIGRIYGYENIDAKLPNIYSNKKSINKKLYYSNKIRDILVNYGFSEVYNYSLVKEGEVELQNPPASNKKFLRTNLSSGIKENLEKNYRNAPILGLDEIKIFEFGNVFNGGKEYTSLSIGYYKKNKKSDEVARDFLEEMELSIEKEVGVNIKANIQNGILELNFDEFIENLSVPEDINSEDYLEIRTSNKNIKYKTISQYPFILRDISIWVPENIDSSEILEIIKNNTGELLVRIDIFDEFKKDNKVSYAFSLVFQSYNRTLDDDEINKIMDKVTSVLNLKLDWQVR